MSLSWSFASPVKGVELCGGSGFGPELGEKLLFGSDDQGDYPFSRFAISSTKKVPCHRTALA